MRELGEPVGLRLGGVVLPQFRVGVRAVAHLRDLTEWSAIGQRGQHRAGREVGSDAHHRCRIYAGISDRSSHARAERLDVVRRDLERPIRREGAVVTWQRRLKDPVTIGGDGASDLSAVSVPKSTPTTNDCVTK